ncbi:MAG: DinB family protein [Bacteroidia bacterium]|nr:DinB family protein [Bacteroidia bacterium]
MIHSQPEITQALADLFKETSAVLSAVKDPEATAKEGGWTIREEFEHMVLAVRPVASGMKLPKLTFLAFGKPNRPVRNYDETYQRYLDRLNNVAPGTGNPIGPKGEDLPSLIKQWDEIGEKFADRMKKWSEKDLDGYLMPHPLMGKILVREMLFFTHFHALHHLQSIKAKAGL